MRRTAPSRALLLLLFSPAAIGLRLPPISFTDRCKAACVAALCSSTLLFATPPAGALTFAELQKLSPEERSAILEQSAAAAAKPTEAPAATVAATPKFKSSLAAAIAETADAFQPIAARYSPEAVAPLASAVTETAIKKVDPLAAAKATDASLKALLTVPPDKLYTSVRALKGFTSALASGQPNWPEKAEAALLGQAILSSSVSPDAAREANLKLSTVVRSVPTRDLIALLDPARPAKEALYDNLSPTEKTRVKAAVKALESEVQALLK